MLPLLPIQSSLLPSIGSRENFSPGIQIGNDRHIRIVFSRRATDKDISVHGSGRHYRKLEIKGATDRDLPNVRFWYRSPP